jgi:hypothetical protein
MATPHPHGRHSSNHPHARQLVNQPHGRLSLAPDANAPLLIVFGGIDVSINHNMLRSGIYMWNYMAELKEKFHIFVAYNHRVNGTECYQILRKTLEAKGLTPSRQILYLFSGGYGPGKQLLTSNGSDLFSSIYLVDIWMKNPDIAKFYMTLTDRNLVKLTYVYTDIGAVNPKARDYIKNKLGRARAIYVPNGAHMKTNISAVGALQHGEA